MPYVERDQLGYVKGRYGVAQPGYAEEWLDEGHPDLYSKTPEQIEREAQQQADDTARQAAKVEPVVQYLVTHTPAECEAYVQANVGNLAQAKDLLGKFAIALCVLARRELR